MSNQPPPPPGQYPPQGGQPYGFRPQQKKSKAWLYILIGVIVGGLLLCGGCFAIVGLGANEAAKEIDKSIKEEAKNDKPKTVEEGKAFKHDGYAVAGGWKVEEAEYGGTTITNMKVTAEEADGESESGRTAWFTFRFYKGSDVLLEVSCTSNEMQVGETSPMDCSGLGDTIAEWDTIKVSDAF